MDPMLAQQAQQARTIDLAVDKMLAFQVSTYIDLAEEVRAYIDPLQERLALDVRFVRDTCGLSDEQVTQLRQAAQTEIDQIAGKTAAALEQKSERSPTVVIINGNGLVVPAGVDTELVTAPRELSQRIVFRALTTNLPDFRQKLDEERNRLDTRRKQAAILAEVAVLDGTMLLSTRQRQDFCERLGESTSQPWCRPENIIVMLDPDLEGLQAALAGGSLGTLALPEVELAKFLQPLQLTIYKEALRSRPHEVVIGRRRLAAKMGPANALLQQVAARQVIGRGLPLDEQRRRLTRYIERQIEGIHARCELSQTQRDKLLLAARLDIEQFAEQGFSPDDKLEGNQERKVIREVGAAEANLPLGIFSHGASHFRRAVRAQLRDAQKQKLICAERERREFHRRALVEAAVAGFEQVAALTSHECEELSLALNGALAEDLDTGDDPCLKCLQSLAQFPVERLGAIFSDIRRPAAMRHQAQIAGAARQFAARVANDDAPRGAGAGFDLFLLAD
ncbi:MAG TPA: hypothetical protein VG125_21395 [Pirellulales bacterium]|nr:hypothetical protein [Pirellulales bacterium]